MVQGICGRAVMTSKKDEQEGHPAHKLCATLLLVGPHNLTKSSRLCSEGYLESTSSSMASLRQKDIQKNSEL